MSAICIAAPTLEIRTDLGMRFVLEVLSYRLEWLQSVRAAKQTSGKTKKSLAVIFCQGNTRCAFLLGGQSSMSRLSITASEARKLCLANTTISDAFGSLRRRPAGVWCNKNNHNPWYMLLNSPSMNSSLILTRSLEDPLDETQNPHRRLNVQFLSRIPKADACAWDLSPKKRSSKSRLTMAACWVQGFVVGLLLGAHLPCRHFDHYDYLERSTQRRSGFDEGPAGTTQNQQGLKVDVRPGRKIIHFGKLVPESLSGDAVKNGVTSASRSGIRTKGQPSTSSESAGWGGHS
ncbi:hypothetical protein C8R47DRAFT_1191487 [Mycena vitilis]|nr:hypothetical protein C8R47DRAFT_1191487 [Mycena vitilis]